MTSNFTKEEIDEFKTEALELLESAETHLLALDGGDEFLKNYEAIFRALHSVKGGAGMLGLQSLQTHAHQLETQFQSLKSVGSISKAQCSYFLSGIDASRQILNDKNVSFKFDFPGRETKSTPPAARNATETLKAAQSIGLVYIVDDEADVVEVLSGMVSSVGFEAAGFTDAKEALEAIKRRRPDTVLTDFKMPVMDGFALLKAVNEVEPELPVIFVSGFLTKELIVKSMSYGLFGIIEKPFSETQIVSQCINAVRRFQLMKLLNRSINFVLYQFSDLDEYLGKTGQEEIRKVMNRELASLLEVRRAIKQAKMKV